MKMPETLQEYSGFAAQSFIQTAVFVDDRIYQSGSSDDHKPKKVVVPKSRGRVLKSAPGENGENATVSATAAEEDTASDSYDIVNSFAKKQIVCSLYQPKKKAKFSRNSDIFPLCSAADVVIVDWDLFGDRGKHALELIDELIAQAMEDVPEQLRLILVYTQEVDLFGVADKIYERVHFRVGDSFEPLEEEGGLAFHTDNSRIAVLGKPGRERADTDPCHIVKESGLADAAIEQFAKLASGILHATTLLGLAEIRKNSRKILSRFGRDLDPAFLTHRAMCPPEEDASSHIVPILVSEIEAVLEDALPSPLIPENLLKDWCNNVWQPGAHLDQLFGQNNPDHRKIAEDICTKGFKQAAKYFKQNREYNSVSINMNRTKNIRKYAKILLPTEKSDANHRFSHLLASRTFYGNVERMLKLGSIVHDRGYDQYLLCIQPICDSVRLKESRVFVFVRMSEGGPECGNAGSHVVFKSDDSAIELVYRPKSYHCFAAAFAPDRDSQKVVAVKDDNGVLHFKDMCGRKYFWIDQLRTSHAQRAVEQFSGDLSRVGLTESEWLRRLQNK